MLWRRIDLPGHEIARLGELEDGWKLWGTAIFAHGNGPVKLDYAVICDAAWRTKSAHVNGAAGDREIDFEIAVDAERRWYLNGIESHAVRGCIDIDLGFSPSTNLLPIRRQALRVGQSVEIRAAWLPFPSLAFEPLPQIYRRESETIYRYESGDGRFVRNLEVNDAGFVIRYPGIWEVETGVV